MNEKSKTAAIQPILWFVTGALITLVSGFAGYTVGEKAQPIPQPERVIPAEPAAVSSSQTVGETVTISFTAAAPVSTVNAYEGVVTLVITGTGRMNGAQTGDAFYTFTDQNQNQLQPPFMQADFTLTLNGRNGYLALDLMNHPLPYSATHTYIVAYDTGQTLRPITFGLSDPGLSDNTGSLTVLILPEAAWLTAPAPALPAEIPEVIASSAGGEIVQVDFRNAKPVYTEQRYQGQVTLLIQGVGQAGSTDWSDAFYLYGRSDGTAYQPPLLGRFAMELDGQMIHEALGETPPYASDHIYRVVYNVGREPRRLAFRNTDLTTLDNRGSYTVEIIQQ